MKNCLSYAAPLLAAIALSLGAIAADAPALASDDQITEQVKAAIAAEPTLKDQKIDVRTKGGEVNLSGLVTDQQLMVTAGHVAEKVPGVKYVINEIDNADYLRDKAEKTKAQ